jgi:16S rRNA (cytidine1402-2'-O)-methyltransferase
MGTLYIVSTPIGNLQDITYRAVKTLFSVDVIACEDTRRMGMFLQQINVTSEENTVFQRPRLLSYFEYNELRRIPEILQMLIDGKNVALASDAGTPAISDPGYKLIRTCLEHGIKVEAIPGASAVLTALVVSGMPTDKFLFIGYLPHKESHARRTLENLNGISALMKTTIIIFEAPHKIIRTLELMKAVLEDKEIVICRELTKMHEESIRGKISEILERFQERTPKGEMVILFQ